MNLLSTGLRLFKLVIIILFIIFFIKVLNNIFFFMVFNFESYAIYLVIFVFIMLFIGILPEKKYKYETFL